MVYDLYIGDRLFSSWSLRAWLMLVRFGLQARIHLTNLYDGDSGRISVELADLAPIHLVPALRLPEGIMIGESLAIAETLAERHPEVGLWPTDALARATARWLCAEMATGFGALRDECPMQLRHVWQDFSPSSEVRKDLARIELLWDKALSMSRDGP